MALEIKKKIRASKGHSECMNAVLIEEKTQINFQVTKKMQHAFKLKATENGEQMTEVLIRFIESYINK